MWWILLFVSPAALDTLLVRNPNLPVEPGVRVTCYGPFFAPPHAKSVVKFQPEANMDIVHHIIVEGGNQKIPHRNPSAGCTGPLDATELVYAWARTGQTTPIPLDLTQSPIRGAAFAVDDYSWFVINIHYQVFSKQRITDNSGVRLTFSEEEPLVPLSFKLMMSYSLRIHPHVPSYDVCQNHVVKTGGKVIAFRNHAHRLARNIWSTRFSKNGQAIQQPVGNLSAQEAQIVRLFPQAVQFEAGERLELHCNYNASDSAKATFLGLDERIEEMCNQYLLVERTFDVDSRGPRASWNIASNWDDTWNSAMSSYAASGKAPRTLPVKQRMLNRSRELTIKQILTRKAQPVQAQNYAKPGQVPSVAVSTDDTIFLLHRGGSDFQGDKVLEFDPIVVLAPQTRAFIRSFGAGTFTVPHGLSVDHRGHLWATDVGTHRVFEFDSATGRLLRTLGTGKAGSDTQSFNKPTDVAIDPTNGDVYVSDGYGNSRVIVFDSEGRFLRQWGSFGKKNGQFIVPHSIALDGRGSVYVADRENSRVQVFSTWGEFQSVWVSDVMVDSPIRPWSRHVSHIRYSPQLDLLIVVEGSGFTIRSRSGCTMIKGTSRFVWPHAAHIMPIGGGKIRSQTNLTESILDSGVKVLIAELDGQRIVEYTGRLLPF